MYILKKGIFIVGTDTDVGKTIISGSIMYLLRAAGYNACYFKPVLSGAIKEGDTLQPLDTLFVKKLAHLKEEVSKITPYIFETPVSPHLASSIENKPIDISVIKNKFKALKMQYDFLIAEGAGGLMVPLHSDGYMLYHLIQDLKIDIWIVARAGLGTINHTLLTVSAAQSLGIRVRGILINQYDSSNPYQTDNIKMIAHLTGIPVIATLPKVDRLSVEAMKFENLKAVLTEQIDIQHLIKYMGEL